MEKKEIEQEAKHFGTVIFWIELILASIIPFVIWWANTPTNVLNSGHVWKGLEYVGVRGAFVLFFAGIPAGIIGIIISKKMISLRVPTLVLSILNLIAGFVEIAVLVLMFYAVLSGVSA